MALGCLALVACGVEEKEPSLDTGPVDYEELCRAGTNAYAIPFDYHLVDDHLAMHTDGGDLKVEVVPSLQL
jgi:hypothetical protein